MPFLKEHINIALLDSGEKVRFKEQSKTKEAGEKSLAHLGDRLLYLGEGVHYSCDGHELKGKQKRHFFTWDTNRIWNSSIV